MHLLFKSLKVSYKPYGDVRPFNNNLQQMHDNKMSVHEFFFFGTILSSVRQSSYRKDE